MSEKQIKDNNNETMDSSEDDDDSPKDTGLEEDIEGIRQFHHNQEENFNFPVFILIKLVIIL